MKPLAAFVFLAVLAQADQLAYEVVSVKVSDSPSTGIGGDAFIRSGGAIALRNVTLHFLINMAYELPDYRLSGGPSWIDTLRYNVDAKPSSRVSRPVALRMMQTLLADRFGLQVHHENKTVGGYRLTAPKGDAKMVKLSPNDGIGFRLMQPGRIEGHGTMAMLATTLQGTMRAPVDDATGLKGAYDMSLEWTLDETSDDGKPSIFSALNESLGLVLKAEKVPIDVLVIDHAEKPDAN
jgi:uncharacterized protein (TIGR03435 family)